MKLYYKYIGFYLFAFVLALPIPLIYSAIALGIMLINGMLLINIFKIKCSFWVYLSVAFVLIDLVRSLIFENFSFKGLDDTKLSFLIVPIIFYNAKDYLINQRRQILMCFTAGVIAYVLYSIGYMFYFYNTYTNYSFSFTDHYIVYMLYNYLPGAYHHTYIGVYIAFAVVILLQQVIELQISFKKVLALTFLILIFTIQVYIGSKMTMIISVLGVAYYLSSFIKNSKKLLVIYSALLSLALFLAYIIRDWLIISINSVWYRVEYLKESMNLISQNYLFGIGLDNIKDNEIIIQGEIKALIPHNVYLHDFLSNGLIGFILILYMFFFLFKRAHENRDRLFLTFTIMCFLLGLTEDFLYLQRGVFFFVFFSSLFLINKKLSFEKKN